MISDFIVTRTLIQVPFPLVSADSKVYYQVYDKASRFQMTPTEYARWETIANRTKADAINYGGTATFDPTWVLVVTWVNQLPRVHYDSATETVSLNNSVCLKQTGTLPCKKIKR